MRLEAHEFNKSV